MKEYRDNDEYEEYDEYGEYEEEPRIPRRKRRKKVWLLGKILFVLAALAVAVATYIGCLGYEMYSRAVTAESVGEMAERIRSTENYVALDELPEIYPKAVVAVEDKRFYEHGGLDIRSIGRAIITNIKDGRFSEGGSTITQQLAKNQFFTQEKKLERKAAEVFAAYDIESTLSKDEILELYINSIYYGDNCYCIYDASIHYFGVEPSELNEYQCIMLAGIPNAPSAYAPTVSPELAEKRQLQVADAMVTAGVINETEKNEILTSYQLTTEV